MMDFIYINVGNFIYLGVQWAISVALVRMGGFEDAGVFSLALTITNTFGMIANYGLRSYQVSDLKKHFSDYTYIASRVVTCSIALLLCIIYALIKKYDISVFFAILFLMIHKCIDAYSDVLSSIWQKNNNLQICGISLGLRGFLNALFFFASYLLTNNVVLSIAAYMISSLIVLLMYDFRKTTVYVNQFLSFEKSSSKNIFSLFYVGFFTMLFAFSGMLFNSIPRLIIEDKFSIGILGIFSSISAPTIIISTFAVGVLIPVTPKIAQGYFEKNNKLLFKTIGVINLVFVSLGIMAEVLSTVIGKKVFVLLFGIEILKYFELFYYLIFASVLSAIVSCYSTVFIAIRKLKQLLLFSTLACVLVFALSLVLIPKCSIYGAAYAMIITLVAQLIAESVYLAAVIHNNGKTDIPSKT